MKEDHNFFQREKQGDNTRTKNWMTASETNNWMNGEGLGSLFYSNSQIRQLVRHGIPHDLRGRKRSKE